MEFFEALNERFSYRGMYEKTPVPREDLTRIVEAGLCAPSGCNAQTTSIIAVDDPALIEKLGGLLGKGGFASAPAAVCVLTQPIIAYQNTTFHVQDYSAAIQNILLAVTALGYASCWVEGYVTGEAGIGKKMAEVLGVPAPYELVAYLPVGIAKDAPRRVTRKPFGERAWFNGFGV
ncbi:MAG: nitroreductase family protein [Oscillospiraceae bacterium]|jgi:nitroreductase|nr:nitroreductase family protein [Oscillospiraceae bacterium]